MDELRGPNIQIVLHVKEGLGFGFLKAPFVVSGSLNGYILETDPVVPCHSPIFDAELVWEADKRRFRNLRVQNVPIKIEVFTMGTQGRKEKIGYLLLSLLGAQPCPANRITDLKHTWHRLLGVKPEGKCCHPQLLLSLSVEDRASVHTPRNELRMFHSNEAAFPTTCPANPATARSMLNTVSEYLAASKKTVVSPELQPKLMCDEGLIQIGSEKQLFVLSFVIATAENLQMLLPPCETTTKHIGDCCITYSIFTHEVMTDRVPIVTESGVCSARFNQRSGLRVRGALNAFSAYFAQCPLVVIRLRAGDKDIGICSMDLRKLVPTDSLDEFLNNFCDEQRSLSIHERCFMLACDERSRRDDGRRAYVDIEIGLKYVAEKREKMRPLLTARSITQLESSKGEIEAPMLDCKSGSCTQLAEVSVAYTSMTPSNTNRYRNANGDLPVKTSEIADMIRQMCDTLTQSKASLDLKRETQDAQVQCEAMAEKIETDKIESEKIETEEAKVETESCKNSEPVKMEPYGKDKQTENEKVNNSSSIPAAEREAMMKKFVDELEDWKERQQELYKIQLQRKEEYHLDLLAKEWSKRRTELENKLRKGIEQCRTLAADLSRATEDFRLRGFRNTERERKLIEAKKALEDHYTSKFQELREASVKMEEDMSHQVRLRDLRIEELQVTIQGLEKKVDYLKNNLKECEKQAESKNSGLTKEQIASLIQELRQTEERLETSQQSKAFFKEQWGRGARELHAARAALRRQHAAALRGQRSRLDGLEPPEDLTDLNELDKMNDDAFIENLLNAPPLQLDSTINVTTGFDGLGMYNDVMTPKNPTNDKLNELIRRRDALVKEDNPDEAVLMKLNQDIRSMLINCAS